jgi:peptidoglycan/xylan/chitin deacetylase (PgdA/CDA1 family)
MRRLISLLLKLLFLTICLFSHIASADNSINVPILTYHRFDPSIPGSMTISTEKFEQQLKWLKENGYTVIPLKELVNYLQGKKSYLPPKPVVITVDDGRKSVYTYMLPLVRKYHIPVTLFIYPSSISHASYALTWEQLKALQKTGLFDIQGHTYWHPNFIQEKKKLSPDEYKKLVHVQLVNSKKILERKLGTPITLLAWPYGIYDHYLEQKATKAGYKMAFSVDDRSASKAENRMAQPRYMVIEEQSMKTFAAMSNGTWPEGEKHQVKR